MPQPLTGLAYLATQTWDGDRQFDKVPRLNQGIDLRPLLLRNVHLPLNNPETASQPRRQMPSRKLQPGISPVIALEVAVVPGPAFLERKDGRGDETQKHDR